MLVEVDANVVGKLEKASSRLKNKYVSLVKRYIVNATTEQHFVEVDDDKVKDWEKLVDELKKL